MAVSVGTAILGAGLVGGGFVGAAGDRRTVWLGAEP